MKDFQSLAGFTNLGLHAIWFYESSDKYVYEFLICVCEYTIVYLAVTANNSILDVMPIFNSVRKISLKILLLIMSFVLTEGQSRFGTSYMVPWWARGWEQAPCRSPLISALHLSPKPTVTHLAVHNYDLVR